MHIDHLPVICYNVTMNEIQVKVTEHQRRSLLIGIKNLRDASVTFSITSGKSKLDELYNALVPEHEGQIGRAHV